MPPKDYASPREFPIFSENDRGQRRSKRKDRHSKIFTAQGPRDRRMRLSIDVARRFFGLQDKLGFEKASSTVAWLMENSRPAIEKLIPRQDNSKVISDNTNEEITSPAKRAHMHPSLARESRVMARERARERTREKKLMAQMGKLGSSVAARSGDMPASDEHLSDNQKGEATGVSTSQDEAQLSGYGEDNRTILHEYHFDGRV